MDNTTEVAFGSKEVISRKELKNYVKRTDRHGLIYFFGHMAILGATGYLVSLSLGTWWIVPTMLAYGIVMAFLFAPVHECSHGTPFRTRWLNESVYWLVSLIYIVPPIFFRYSHAAHHTYTQVRGRDQDMIFPRQATVWNYIVYVSSIPFWIRNISWLIRHALGSVNPKYRYYLPDEEIPRIVREARIIIAIYLGIALIAIYASSWAPLTYWIIPRLVGEPFMRWLRVAEHGECEEGPDLRENTRTTKTSSLVRFLFWNMPYHAEHHLSPMVPFHALPRLHEQVKDKLFPTADSYLKVHAQVLKRLLRQQGITWETSKKQKNNEAF